MRRDFHTPPARKKYNWPRIFGALLTVLLAWLSITSIISFINQPGEIPITQQRALQPDFPTIPTKNLTVAQRSILKIIREEYEKAPRHFDNTVLAYTEGARESWCADFISWVFLKANIPLTNPNSDYWRIPGVLTLQQYYKDNNAYIDTASKYTPRLGDIAFYVGAQTPDSSSEEHAAIVLKVDGDNLTTIGGNEADGIMRIRTESLQKNIDKSLVGFGKFAT